MKTLYLFNPENDMALACGDSYYMPPASARRMAADLSVLPAWYAAPGDAVLTDALLHGEQVKIYLRCFLQWSLSPDYLLPILRYLPGDGTLPYSVGYARQESRIRLASQMKR